MELSQFLAWMGRAQIVLPFLLAVLIAPIERVFPRRSPVGRFAVRWRTNAVLAIASIFVVMLAAKVLANMLVGVGVALRFTNFSALPMPDALTIVLSLLFMDFCGYLLHVMSHRVGFLWRLHQIHHCDNHFDASTGLRHHPLESVVGLCVLTVVYVAVGMPMVAIAGYGGLLAAVSIFSHANLSVPERVDQWLRLVLVTPDLHRIHHSTEPAEYESNFGQVFPFWDRMLGTLRPKPLAPEGPLQLGVTELGDCSDASAFKLTLASFRARGAASALPPIPAPAVAPSPTKNSGA